MDMDVVSNGFSVTSAVLGVLVIGEVFKGIEDLRRDRHAFRKLSLTGVHDNGIDLDPDIGDKGFAGALAASGYDTSFFGKAHLATYHTFQPTGSKEFLRPSADVPDTWCGLYMGFDHVELMLVRHNWFLPEKPPAGQHYER